MVKRAYTEEAELQGHLFSQAGAPLLYAREVVSMGDRTWTEP